MPRITRCLACKEVSDRPGAMCSKCEAKRCNQCGKVSVYGSQTVNDPSSGRTLILCPRCMSNFQRIHNSLDTSYRPDSINQRLEILENKFTQLETIVMAFVRGQNSASTAPVLMPSDLDNPDDAIDRMLSRSTDGVPAEDIQTRIQKDLETLHSKPEVSTKEDNPNS